MLEDKIAEIKNDLLGMEAETGELTEAQIDTVIQTIGEAIAEHYKMEEIPDTYIILETLENIKQDKQRKQMLEEIVIPAIDELNNTQIK